MPNATIDEGRPIRFGVIGCGTIAEHRHIPTLIELPGAELVALADPRTDQLERLSRKFQIDAVYANYHELLARDDIDAVTVATPVGAHAPVVLDCARARKHVFCEKPPADDEAAAERMYKAMLRAGRLLAFNLEARFRSDSQTIRRWLAEGRIGRPRYWRFIHNWRGGRWAGIDRYRNLIGPGMGPIVDCGIHDFDLLLWLSNADVVDLTAQGIWMEGYENPDHVVATCRLSDGGLAVIDHSWVYGHRSEEPVVRKCIEIEGTDGLIVSEGDTCTLYAPNGTVREHVENERPFPQIYSAFITKLRQVAAADLGLHAVTIPADKAVVARDLPVGEQGIRALRLSLRALRCATESSRTGREVAAADESTSLSTAAAQ